MKPKIYTTGIVENAVQVLADVPALKPKCLSHEAALCKLQKSIKTLYIKKNYDPKSIVQLLKQSRIKTTLREVKKILEIED